MTVVLTAPVEAKQPGESYTGANEAYLLASGYARKVRSGEVQTLTETGSGLTSFTITHSGQTTASIDDDATAAQVQTALEALSNLAPGDVTVTGGPLGTGPFSVRFADNVAHALVTTTPTGGTGAVAVANSGTASVTGPGLENTGVADTTIANNREFDATRGQIAASSDSPAGGTNDGVVLVDADAPFFVVTGNDAAVSAGVVPFDGFGNGDPIRSLVSVKRVVKVAQPTGSQAIALAAAGGTALKLRGFRFTGVTSVTFGGTAGTSFSVVDDQHILVTTPAKAAGAYDVVVVHAGGNATKAASATFV